MTSVVIYDIETKTIADDHPGRWNDIKKFGMSLAVTWDNVTHTFRTWEDAKGLYDDLLLFDRIPQSKSRVIALSLSPPSR